MHAAIRCNSLLRILFLLLRQDLSAIEALTSVLSSLVQKMLPHWPQWLRQRRLVVNAISTGIETDIFTPYIVRFATRWRKLVHYWFLLGALVGVTCFVLTLTYLLPSYILARIWPSGEASSVSVQVIVR